MVELRALVLLFLTIGLAIADEVQEPERQEKVLFDIVRFKNEPCTGSSNAYNGTCYTKEECEQKAGTASGSCASGYGVCCTFVMGCGSVSGQNNTYLVKATSDKDTSPCTYTICKCSTEICRIRFDFTSFDIAGPITAASSTVASNAENGPALGDCRSDTFSITAPGTTGSPVICGKNTGHHMILDASNDCHKVNFKLGSVTGVTRSWNIRVTQYQCDDLNLGGPPGCLQYFDSDSGAFASYNFDITAAAVTTSTTHLSNQCYTYCFRRNSGKCSICYYPQIAPANNQLVSFGLSISAIAGMDTSAINTRCSSDYISIPGGVVSPSSRTAAATTLRNCGRYLNVADATNAATTSVCSYTTPFKVTFKTDADEVAPSTAAATILSELVVAIAQQPSGALGFYLNFKQVNC